MAYLNPFELLQTFADDGGDEWHDFDEKSLRRVRRRVIAEADLEGTLRFNNQDLSKNEIAAILDELDDEDHFENHRVIYEKKLLLNFLTNGNTSIFDIKDEYDIYDYCADFDLIIQPFSVQFNKLFAGAFNENDARQIEQMSRFTIFVDDDVHLQTCFKSVEKSLKTRIEEYETLLSEIKAEEFDADGVDALLDEISDAVDAETLNALPDYFELRRDSLASTIDQIAVNLYNNYDETEIAFALSEIADEIEAESLSEKRIRHNKGVFKSDLAKIEFAKRLKKIERVSSISKQLKKLRIKFKARFTSETIDKLSGNELFISKLKSQIQNILEFDEINSLSDELEISESLRDSIALELKKLTFVSYNLAKDLDFAEWLLDSAMQIRVSIDTSEALLKNKKHVERLKRKRIEQEKQDLESELARQESERYLKKNERVSSIAERLRQMKSELTVRVTAQTKDNLFGNRLFISGLKDEIQEILDFNEINKLSEYLDFAENLRDSIALELKKLSVIGYNHANDLDFSLSLIEMALQIKVSPSTYDVLLKSKNHLISKKPVANYPPWIYEAFYGKDDFSESEKSKTDSDKNNKSENTNKTNEGENSNYKQTQNKTNNKYDTAPLFNYKPAEEKSRLRPIMAKVIGGVALIIVAIVCFNNLFDGKISNLDADLQKMNAGAGFSVPEKTSEKLNQVKLKRKLLPIDATKTVNLDFYNRMPPDLKADLFTDVKILALIDCRVDEFGFINYNPLRYGTIMKCDLTAVDKDQNVVVLKKTFEEHLSDKVKTLEIPYKRIINYLIENSEK